MRSPCSVLVTGGAGYIGSHAAKALHASGLHPIIYDDFSNGHREAVRWGTCVTGDIRNRTHLAETMSRHGVNSVLHFAGLIEVGRSVQDPASFWDVNVNGVWAVLGAMRDAGVSRLVFSSSAAVYGEPSGEYAGCIDETCPTLPINPYGEGKLAAERMIAASCRAYGLEAVALRYFNAAGADRCGELGEAHHDESHLIPLAVEAALGLSPPLTIFGDDFATPDGSCLRDYVHVADLAQAHCDALSLPLARGDFLPLNLGGGRAHSVHDILAAVQCATGCAVPHRIGPRRPGDPPVLVANVGQARARLGWSAQTDLTAIVASAVAWRLAPKFGLAAPCSSAAS